MNGVSSALRQFGTAGLCAASLLLFTTIAASQTLRSIPSEGVLNFRVFMSGQDIGRKTVHFKRDGELLRVDTHIEMVARFAFIPVYRYEHRNQETWRGDDLEALDAWTNDDGKQSEVKVRTEGDMLRMIAGARSLRLPRDARPSNYWHQLLISTKTGINNQLGEAIALETTAIGSETLMVRGAPVKTQRFKLLGYDIIYGERAKRPYLDVDLWYDELGLLVHMTFPFKGFNFVYVLE
jgi:hypothetical protein